MRMLFSFFDYDTTYVVAEPVVYIQYAMGTKVSSKNYQDLPRLKEVWFSNLIQHTFQKSRQAYLKKHSKAFHTYKRKGYRHRR